MPRQSILVISFSELHKDPRVYRQIQHLAKEGYHVTACGFSNPDIDHVHYIPIDCPPPRQNTFSQKLGKLYKLCSGRASELQWLSSIITLIKKDFEGYYWNHPFVKNTLKKIQHLHFDLIIANDLDTLPLCSKIKNGGKLLFDAHEYAPREFEDSLKWRLLYQKYREFLAENYIPNADKMITVSQGIAEEYERNFNTSSVAVINNAPSWENLKPSPVSSHEIRMIHHGGAIPVRNIHGIVHAMKKLDERFKLDLILIPGCPKYIEKIKKIASRDNRIKILPPVPMKDISIFCNQYDLGVFILKPLNFNSIHALPNKLFEFIQGRLGAVVSPLPEMKAVVDKFHCGITTNGYSANAIAETLSSLTTEKIQLFKENAHLAASILCAQENMKKFDRIIAELLCEKVVNVQPSHD